MSNGHTTIVLPPDVVALLRRGNPCVLTTLMPDGSPQLTQVWVDTDGNNVLINTGAGHQKALNVVRDPRVAVAVLDAEALHRYVAIRGRVVDITGDGAAEHIDKLSQRYTGRPYPWYGGRDQRRVIMTIAPRSVHRVA